MTYVLSSPFFFSFFLIIVTFENDNEGQMDGLALVQNDRRIATPDVMEYIDLDDLPDLPADFSADVFSFLNDDDIAAINELGRELEFIFGQL